VRTYRLPTEAEWEMACRAGSTSRFFFGDDYRQLQKYANLADASLQAVWTQREQNPNLQIPVGTPLPPYAMPWDDKWPFPAVVGKFEPNNWGLYDMHGNVGEWCTDWYDPGYYATSPTVDPTGPAEAVAPEIDVGFIPGLPPAIPKKRKLRVIRGGVWLDPVVAMRSADRRNHVRHPVDAAADIGFRVVMEWNAKDWDPFEPETA
jgi:formylglycine-generating enzyme required for sulfatase activity